MIADWDAWASKNSESESVSRMPNQVNRRDMERWLRDHGFTLAPGKKTGHVFYVRGAIKITLPGHGPQDLTKKHVALILRHLEAAGFDKEQIRRELDA